MESNPGTARHHLRMKVQAMEAREREAALQKLASRPTDCAICKKPAKAKPGTPVVTCPTCDNRVYCSKGCKKKDDSHKKKCAKEAKKAEKEKAILEAKALKLHQEQSSWAAERTVEITGLPDTHLHYGYMGVYQVDDIWSTTKQGIRPRYKQVESLAGPEWGNKGRLHWFGGICLKALIDLANATEGKEMIFEGLWRITDKAHKEQNDDQSNITINDLPPLFCHSRAADAAAIEKTTWWALKSQTTTNLNFDTCREIVVSASKVERKEPPPDLPQMPIVEIRKLARRFGILLKNNPSLASTFFTALPEHILCEALGDDREGSSNCTDGRSFDVGALDNPACWELKAFLDQCPLAEQTRKKEPEKT